MTQQVFRATIAGMILTMASVVASAQTQYALVDLGQVDGTGSFAVGINDSGQIGGWVITPSHDTRAVRSTNAQPFAYVAPLQSLSISTEGINSAGDLTGNVVVSPFPAFAYHAFRYSDTDGLVDLGTLGGQSSTGVAINAHGQVAGWSYTSSGIPRAFRSTPGQPLQELPLFSGATAQSFAGGINDAGQVSGYVEVSSGVFHAFRFSDGQPALDLGSLGGVFGSTANRINALGQVVGQASTPSSGGHAFRYTDGVGMQDLDTRQTNNSVGWDINAAGDVVGYFVQNNTSRAFLYTDQTGMVDLNSFINSGSGWTLTAAYGINNLRQIVGIGTFNGQANARAFLLTPDLIPPAISAAQASPSTLWPANHKLVPVHVTVTVTDNLDPAPRCQIVSVASTDLLTDGDFVITADLDVQLRADAVTTDGRTYSLTVRCSDGASNSASTVVLVKVPHDQSEK